MRHPHSCPAVINALTALSLLLVLVLCGISCKKEQEGEEQPADLEEDGFVSIADESFVDYCLANFDLNNDDKISLKEAALVQEIQVSGLGIIRLTGIEDFVNLTSLNCSNNQLSSSDQMDIRYNTALTTLDCSGNQFKDLDFSANTALTSLNCSKNQLTLLKIGANTALASLDCSGNQLTGLYISNNTALTSLDCSDNQLQYLDVSNNTRLNELYCKGNPLDHIYLKNGQNIPTLEIPEGCDIIYK